MFDATSPPHPTAALSVFGLGDIGCVSPSLASRGRAMVGGDTNPSPVDLLHRGTAPVADESINMPRTL